MPSDFFRDDEKVKAEHDRKTKELEEARQLQLSMLPKKLPQLPHLDIAAYMKTATEVGGDYYDFHLGDDGTLTIAVGDATGHGLKAGTMVASVKSLFMTLAYHPDIPHIFARLSQTLKQMNLRGLFMAMTIAKVKGHRLTISIAGMPPAWIYRASCQQIEEVALKQLPLGGVTKYAYQQNEYELASGDVVVLLSDGLPERFNEQGVMLEDEAVQSFITAHPHLSAQDLINGLVKLGDDWGSARPQDDDVTLVVLKVR
jgi:serine phosphatase RsbU (regulator of sigma subunit)